MISISKVRQFWLFGRWWLLFFVIISISIFILLHGFFCLHQYPVELQFQVCRVQDLSTHEQHIPECRPSSSVPHLPSSSAPASSITLTWGIKHDQVTKTESLTSFEYRNLGCNTSCRNKASQWEIPSNTIVMTEQHTCTVTSLDFADTLNCLSGVCCRKTSTWSPFLLPSSCKPRFFFLVISELIALLWRHHAHLHRNGTHYNNPWISTGIPLFILYIHPLHNCDTYRTTFLEGICFFDFTWQLSTFRYDYIKFRPARKQTLGRGLSSW